MLKVLEVALAEVGYTEKKSNANLDSKEGNSGFNNFTKYARDLDALGDFYNSQKQGPGWAVPWCEIFVDWCFWKAYGEDMALRLLCQPKRSAGAGCTQSAEYYKRAGQFFKTPKVGDQIYFTWGGEIEHTGLVYAVKNGMVYTVEGNTSSGVGVVPNGGAVCRKSYVSNSSAIYGYGRPDYSLVDQLRPEPEPVPEPTPPEKPKEDEVKMVTVKIPWVEMGSTGEPVRTLQRLLISNGFSVGLAGCDSICGEATRAAIMAYQKSVGLEMDGICGPATWKAILGVA